MKTIITGVPLSARGYFLVRSGECDEAIFSATCNLVSDTFSVTGLLRPLPEGF